MFYFSLEYSSPYYKEGCNMVILTKPKVLKTKIVSMSDVRKPNSKSVLKSVTPVRPILNTRQTGWTYLRAYPPLAGFQRLWLDMSDPQARHVRPAAQIYLT
jgi:hypothetical protein